MMSKLITNLLLIFAVVLSACSDSMEVKLDTGVRSDKGDIVDNSNPICSTTNLLPADDKVDDYKKVDLQIESSTQKITVTFACCVDDQWTCDIDLPKPGAAFPPMKWCLSLERLIRTSAEFYRPYGFSCMTLARYASAIKKTEIEVWIFDQTNVSGAASTMNAFSGTDLIPTIGDESKGYIIPDGYIVRARKGKIVIYVIIIGKVIQPNDALNMLREIINTI